MRFPHFNRGSGGADRGRAKVWLCLMRRLRRYRSAPVLAARHAFMLNLCCGHYDVATDFPFIIGSASHSTSSR